MNKMIKYLKGGLTFGGVFFLTSAIMAQNPLIMTQFTADPSARVFNGKVYIYPSHDIAATPGHGRANWFCMQDYHVFSSSNLIDWTDHGVIVNQNQVPWADSTAYSMWAPDCIERNGKFYFYFPATVKTGEGRGFAVGVAVADKPSGPFVPEVHPIAGIHGIDPNVQIDKDGQAYIYWALGNIYGAKLKTNMLELASEPVKLQGFPDQGLKEGPYLFERKGIYYMTYPHAANKTERLEYAMANNPLGPFKYAGVIMDESASGCWTNHQSVIEFNHQWFLFYHNDDLSPSFDKHRSVRADSLFFNEDGTIRKVMPTFRGIGETPAGNKIQIDRFSAKSLDAQIDFLDTLDHFKGWKTLFSKPGAWVQYNAVRFGPKSLKQVCVYGRAPAGATLLIKTNDMPGKIIAELTLPRSTEWTLIQNTVLWMPATTKNLIVQLRSGVNAEVDWISFK